MPDVAQTVGIRFGSTTRITSTRPIHYSDSRVVAGDGIRYGSTRRVSKSVAIRYGSIDDDTVESYLYGEGDLSISEIVYVNGTPHDLACAPATIEITMAENEPSQWAITIIDPTGYYHPKKVGGVWEGIMTDEAFDSSGDVIRYVEITASIAGQTLNFTGVPTRAGHSRSSSNAGTFNFSWSGVDLTRKLFLPGKTSETIRTGAGVTWTTKTAIQDLLTPAGIDADLSQMDDAPIRVQHRQDGRPADWMQALCDVLLTRWRMEHRTLKFYQPAYTGAAQWIYPANSAIMEDSFSIESFDVVNKVIAKRAAESKSQTSAPVEVYNFGQYTTTFNPPISYVTWRILVQGAGRFSDIAMYDASGGLIAVRLSTSAAFPSSAFTATSIEVATIRFTWGQLAGGGVLTGSPGQIQFFGAENDPEELGANDPIYTVTRSNTASINAYGEHLQELPPNPLIFNSEILTRHADAYLVEHSTQLAPQSFTVPLNLMIRPGQRIQVIDDRLGYSPVRYIVGCAHTISEDPRARRTSIDTVIYE